MFWIWCRRRNAGIQPNNSLHSLLLHTWKSDTKQRHESSQNCSLATISQRIFSMISKKVTRQVCFVTFVTLVDLLPKPSTIITVASTNLDLLHFLPLVTALYAIHCLSGSLIYNREHYKSVFGIQLQILKLFPHSTLRFNGIELIFSDIPSHIQRSTGRLLNKEL